MPGRSHTVDHAVLHDRLGQPLDDVVPPGRIADRIFEGDEVVRQGRADLNEGRKARKAVRGAVRGDQDAVQVGIFGNPFQLGDAADVAGVGADDVDGVAFDQVLEVLAQVDLLAGVDRRRGAARDLAIDVGIDEGHVVAGDQVFEPHQMDRLEGAGEADRVRHRPAGPAIEGKADLVAQNLLHGADAVDDVPQPPLGDEPPVEGAVAPTREGSPKKKSGTSRFIGL